MSASGPRSAPPDNRRRSNERVMDSNMEASVCPNYRNMSCVHSNLGLCMYDNMVSCFNRLALQKYGESEVIFHSSDV
jgi:hypothetical protein